MAEYLDGLSLWDIEKKFVTAISTMEQAGVLIDRELAASEYNMGQNIMARITKDLGGLRPSSPKELKVLLIDQLGLPLVKPTDATKGLPSSQQKPSFDKYAMEEYELLLAHRKDDTAKRILEYRGWQKATSTYFKAFIEKACPDGRIRPNFKLHGTRTSRLSCENPNFQQIPRETNAAKRWNLNTKKCIIPSDGWRLWELDYSNLELRLAAVYAQETKLIDAFNRGDKIWDYMSGLLGGWEKNTTKTTTYAVLYGAGSRRLANTLGISNAQGKRTKDNYFATFPRIHWASESVNRGAKDQGFIRYWTGRRRHFPASESSHKAFNSLLQGGGAEIVKRALIEAFETVCDEFCRLVLTVHDSIVFEIKDGYEHMYLPSIQCIMERIPTMFFDMSFTVDCHEWGMAA